MADVRKLIDALRVPMANQTNPYTKNGIPNVDLAETGQFVNSFMPISGDIQSGIQAVSDVKNKKYADALLNSVGLLPFVPSLGGVIKEINPVRTWMPNIRGEWTKDKIAKELKNEAAYSGTHGNYPQRHIADFESPEEFSQNLFWHGTGGNVSGALKPSMAMPLRDVERMGGGGYGEQYWGTSLSGDKNLASNFTGQSTSGKVYPVILKKGSNVKELPHIQDANELDDIIESLWKDKVDAVKIGDWTSPHSEKELVVLNPKAAWKYDQPTNFSVFNKQKFENPSQQEIADMYNKAVEHANIINESRKLPSEERNSILQNLEKIF
jgi:hypothetical protein